MYELYVNNEKKYFSKLNFSDFLDFSRPGKFEAYLPSIANVSLGSSIEIKRNGSTIFKGIVENIGKTISESGVETRLEGRDLKYKLITRVTDRDVYVNTDPKNIIQNVLNAWKPLYVPQRRIVLFPSDDSYTFKNYPDKNYGDIETAIASTWNYLGYYPYWQDDHHDSYIKFDLSKLTGAIISSAYLKLYVVQTANSYASCLMRRCLSDWSEETLTFNNAPAGSSDYISVDQTQGGLISINVTGNVQSFLNNTYPNHGWVFHLYEYVSPKQYWVWKTKDSKDYNDRPRLAITRTESNLSDVTASHNDSDAPLAYDGNTNTYWDSKASQATGMWIKLDLGALYNIGKIRIIQRSDGYARSWKLEVSVDDTNWTQVGSSTSETRAVFTVAFPSGNYRYIKFSLTGDYNQANWKVCEIIPMQAESQIIQSDLSNFGQNITFRVDYNSIADVIARICEITGWKAWIGLDGKLYYKLRKGSDRTSDFRFEVGKNCFMLEHEINIRDLANVIIVLAHGKGYDQLRAILIDHSSISKYGRWDKVFRISDIVDQNALVLFACELQDALSDPIKRIVISTSDEYAGDLQSGDDVWLKANEFGIDQAFTIQSITRKIDNNGIEVLLELANFQLDPSIVFSRLSHDFYALASVSSSLTARNQAE